MAGPSSSRSGRFAADTAVVAAGAGRWTTSIHPDWFAPAGPNGGYLAAIVARAMQAEVADEERPLRSLTLHYLRRTDVGRATVATTLERAGRSLSSVAARLEQGGRRR
ncbi:MAG: thioesterase family protein [Acidimicrobiia bacterium]|nr:thioesterase family protein [Acidimicrobiia bacterium]